MNDPMSFRDAVNEIQSRDGRFAAEAFGFLMDSMEYTLRTIGQHRHVSAAELLQGLCDFARARYGVMSCTLLESWGVTTTGHIGDLVFHLVEASVLARREEDRREDFDDVFDLREVLEKGYFDGSEDRSDAM